MAFGEILLAGYSGQSRGEQDGSARVANHSARFGSSHGASHIITHIYLMVSLIEEI